MLPAIRRSAQISFRKVRPELRGELIEEVVANCYVAYARLIERGQADRVCHPPWPALRLPRSAPGAVLGTACGSATRYHPTPSTSKQFFVEPLDQFDEEEDCWQQILIEDKRATPAEVAACRIDFAEWLRRLTARLRKIALALASGETTKGAAEKFGLSPARISQLREWLKKSWEAFQGEPVTASASAA